MSAHDPNLYAVWQPTRPDFTIKHTHGTSTQRGYHENFYDVVSRVGLTDEDFKALSDIGLLGMGQAYDTYKRDPIIDTVPCVMVDRRTGKVVEGMQAVNWQGEPITTTTDYKYYHWMVRRICDSGD